MTSPRVRLRRRLCLVLLACFSVLFVGFAMGDDAPPDAAPATPEEAQRWLEENLPRWRVYLTGPEDGPHCDPKNPMAMDAYCQLAAQRQDEHGTDEGKPILFSAWWLRGEGGAYLHDVVDGFHLSMLDIVAIQAAIEVGIAQGGLDVHVDTSEAKWPSAILTQRWNPRA